MAGELTITLNENDYAYVQSKLSKLTKLEKNAVVQKGLQEGLSIIAKEGRKTLKSTLSKDPWNTHMREYMAKKRGGSLQKSIGTKTIKKKLKGYSGFKKHGHHAHLVDSGTVNRWTKKGAFRGKVAGSRFWRTAFDNKRNQAVKELMESIRKSIQKLAK